MNQEQSQLLATAERTVAALRQPMEELENAGGKAPTAALKEYDRMRAEAFSLDIEIAHMLPPKKGDEGKVTSAMQRLEMLVNSVQTFAQIMESEVKNSKRKFYDARGEVVGEIEKTEAKSDEQILAAFRDLAKALHIRWGITEKKFRLSQYVNFLSNEFSTNGVSSPPASVIYLPWGEKIAPVQSKLSEAYLRRFLSLLGKINPDNLTVETFKNNQT
jgi:hypothetical protein